MGMFYGQAWLCLCIWPEVMSEGKLVPHVLLCTSYKENKMADTPTALQSTMGSPCRRREAGLVWTSAPYHQMLSG